MSWTRQCNTRTRRMNYSRHGTACLGQQLHMTLCSICRLTHKQHPQKDGMYWRDSTGQRWCNLASHSRIVRNPLQCRCHKQANLDPEQALRHLEHIKKNTRRNRIGTLFETPSINKSPEATRDLTNRKSRTIRQASTLNRIYDRGTTRRKSGWRKDQDGIHNEP